MTALFVVNCANNYIIAHFYMYTDEVLVALSMLSLTDENCKKALSTLPQLDGCQVHATVMLSEVDRKIFKKLGIGLTTDPMPKTK